jgi:hypothetical protein
MLAATELHAARINKYPMLALRCISMCWTHSDRLADEELHATRALPFAPGGDSCGC